MLDSSASAQTGAQSGLVPSSRGAQKLEPASDAGAGLPCSSGGIGAQHGAVGSLPATTDAGPGSATQMQMPSAANFLMQGPMMGSMPGPHPSFVAWMVWQQQQQYAAMMRWHQHCMQQQQQQQQQGPGGGPGGSTAGNMGPMPGMSFPGGMPWGMPWMGGMQPGSTPMPPFNPQGQMGNPSGNPQQQQGPAKGTPWPSTGPMNPMLPMGPMSMGMMGMGMGGTPMSMPMGGSFDTSKPWDSTAGPPGWPGMMQMMQAGGMPWGGMMGGTAAAAGPTLASAGSNKQLGTVGGGGGGEQVDSPPAAAAPAAEPAPQVPPAAGKTAGAKGVLESKDQGLLDIPPLDLPLQHMAATSMAMGPLPMTMFGMPDDLLLGVVTPRRNLPNRHSSTGNLGGIAAAATAERPSASGDSIGLAGAGGLTGVPGDGEGGTAADVLHDPATLEPHPTCISPNLDEAVAALGVLDDDLTKPLDAPLVAPPPPQPLDLDATQIDPGNTATLPPFAPLPAEALQDTAADPLSGVAGIKAATRADNSAAAGPADMSLGSNPTASTHLASIARGSSRGPSRAGSSALAGGPRPALPSLGGTGTGGEDVHALLPPVSIPAGTAPEAGTTTDGDGGASGSNPVSARAARAARRSVSERGAGAGFGAASSAPAGLQIKSESGDLGPGSVLESPAGHGDAEGLGQAGSGVPPELGGGEGGAQQGPAHDELVPIPMLLPGPNVAAWGSSSCLGSGIAPMSPGSVPSPMIYVSSKRVAAILRRRQQRARQNGGDMGLGVMRHRKPYLHRSRHEHAARRVRGPGGRFSSAASAPAAPASGETAAAAGANNPGGSRETSGVKGPVKKGASASKASAGAAAASQLQLADAAAAGQLPGNRPSSPFMHLTGRASEECEGEDDLVTPGGPGLHFGGHTYGLGDVGEGEDEEGADEVARLEAAAAAMRAAAAQLPAGISTGAAGVLATVTAQGQDAEGDAAAAGPVPMSPGLASPPAESAAPAGDDGNATTMATATGSPASAKKRDRASAGARVRNRPSRPRSKAGGGSKAAAGPQGRGARAQGGSGRSTATGSSASEGEEATPEPGQQGGAPAPQDTAPGSAMAEGAAAGAGGGDALATLQDPGTTSSRPHRRSVTLQRQRSRLSDIELSPTAATAGTHRPLSGLLAQPGGEASQQPAQQQQQGQGQGSLSTTPTTVSAAAEAALELLRRRQRRDGAAAGTGAAGATAGTASTAGDMGGSTPAVPGGTTGGGSGTGAVLPGSSGALHRNSSESNVLAPLAMSHLASALQPSSTTGPPGTGLMGGHPFHHHHHHSMPAMPFGAHPFGGGMPGAWGPMGMMGPMMGAMMPGSFPQPPFMAPPGMGMQMPPVPAPTAVSGSAATEPAALPGAGPSLTSGPGAVAGTSGAAGTSRGAAGVGPGAAGGLSAAGGAGQRQAQQPGSQPAPLLGSADMLAGMGGVGGEEEEELFTLMAGDLMQDLWALPATLQPSGEAPVQPGGATDAPAAGSAPGATSAGAAAGSAGEGAARGNAQGSAAGEGRAQRRR